MSGPIIRKAKPGEELAIHEAHMRSIREVAVKDHGPEEIKGWGYRPFVEGRWRDAVAQGSVLVVEVDGRIEGMGHLRLTSDEAGVRAHLHALYLTPVVVGSGVGLKMAQMMIETARSAGAPSISLGSSITGYEFYKKIGFVDNGSWIKVDIGGHPVSAIEMILRLK